MRRREERFLHRVETVVSSVSNCWLDFILRFVLNTTGDQKQKRWTHRLIWRLFNARFSPRFVNTFINVGSKPLIIKPSCRKDRRDPIINATDCTTTIDFSFNYTSSDLAMRRATGCEDGGGGRGSTRGRGIFSVILKFLFKFFVDRFSLRRESMTFLNPTKTIFISWSGSEVRDTLTFLIRLICLRGRVQAKEEDLLWILKKTLVKICRWKSFERGLCCQCIWVTDR